MRSLRIHPSSCSLALAFALLLAAASRGQSNVANFWGAQTGENVGSAVVEVGDVNGDGYHDLVTSAPDAGTYPTFGAVYFVSGKYLATGSGFATIGSVFASTGDENFASSILALGDVTGDGIGDLAIGESGDVGFVDTGSVRIVSGATRTVVANRPLTPIYLGLQEATSMALCSDLDSDGVPDIAVGGPCPGWIGRVRVLSTKKLLDGLQFFSIAELSGGELFGTSVSAGDLDGDGKRELVIGDPSDNASHGKVYVYRGTNLSLWKTFTGSGSSSLGAALDATRDIDGDGLADVLAGAPTSDAGCSACGEVVLYSGAKIAAGTPPYDVVHWYGLWPSTRFGAAVAASPDANGDSHSDVVVGAPDYSTFFPSTVVDRGALYFYSGETFAPMGSVLGPAAGDHLGASVSRAWDYTGDGRSEVAAGAPNADVGSADVGIVRLYSMFPSVPAAYCTNKLNSLGCGPVISYAGSPSVSSSSAFSIRASNVLNKKNGLLFYGYQPSGAAFQGGHLCVKAPVKRTSVQGTGGSATGNDCTGSLSFDFNAYIQSGADPALATLGQQVFCQYWSRDPSSPSTTSLTNALRFLVNP